MSTFTFNISLSVLNHLGRNLYRSFITVLGEAISNAWDADAKNVWIYLDKQENLLLIKDDGLGMTASDFQDKFLKIGYSKRKNGVNRTALSRPFIGRKGIGKLALLSCAERISILTKTRNTEYVGGTIDNRGLDQAITNDLTPQEYLLGDTSKEKFSRFINNHESGTILFFDNIKDGIKNTEDYLKKVIALYFRFSLLDNDFNIYFNNQLIGTDQLQGLADKSQFLWIINDSKDPYLNERILPNSNLKKLSRLDIQPEGVTGFIATVNKPKDLKIITTDEKVSIDLFVNGRLREKDILKHISSASVVESYMYGQIHFNKLDDGLDRFTTSREGIISDDELFKDLLESLRPIIRRILEDWDKWRIELREDGDSENKRITRKERKSRELFNVISDDFIPPAGTSERDKIEDWVKKLTEDAQFNLSTYGECFVSENLLRMYIKDRSVPLSTKATNIIDEYKALEARNKGFGNLSIEIRQNNDGLSYLSMNDLTDLVDKPDSKVSDPNKVAALTRDAKEYKPVRDAMAHTALLTVLAKNKLTSTYENIKARVKQLLNNP